MKHQNFTPEEQAQIDFNSMITSAETIQEEIASGLHLERQHSKIEKNIRHIEIVMKRKGIKEGNFDLSQFNAVIEAGRNYINGVN